MTKIKKENPYDGLYKQIDMKKKPFGYTVDYLLWRTSQLKKPWSKYIIKNGKILDVGRGTGLMAQFLPDFVNKNHYYNLDVSLQMLKCSPYNNILSSAEQIPCPDNSFDYVISSDVLEHVNSKTEAINECYRVLKHGGQFFLSTPRTGWLNDFKKSPFLPFLIMDSMLNNLRPKDSEFQVPEGVKDEPSDEKWLKETLENVGFTVLKQYRADNHVPWGRAGKSRFWRWFADRFVNPKKYGHCTVVICSK